MGSVGVQDKAKNGAMRDSGHHTRREGMAGTEMQSMDKLLGAASLCHRDDTALGGWREYRDKVLHKARPWFDPWECTWIITYGSMYMNLTVHT